MHVPASLIATAIIVIVLSGIALITWANRRGHAAGGDDYRQLIKIREEKIAELLYTSARERSDAAQAMEDLEEHHRQELERQQRALRTARNHADQTMLEQRAGLRELNQITAAHAALTERCFESDRTIEALRATSLTAMEITLIDSMTQKLRLASPVFHAQQQFADARKARELAARGDTLVRRLLPDDAAQENAA